MAGLYTLCLCTRGSVGSRRRGRGRGSTYNNHDRKPVSSLARNSLRRLERTMAVDSWSVHGVAYCVHDLGTLRADGHME